jgi:hypothetical protein
VERDIQTVRKRMAANFADQMLLSLSFWGHNMKAVCTAINSFPNTKCPHTSPLYEFTGVAPNVASFTTKFGEPGVVSIVGKTTRNQFDSELRPKTKQDAKNEFAISLGFPMTEAREVCASSQAGTLIAGPSSRTFAWTLPRSSSRSPSSRMRIGCDSSSLRTTISSSSRPVSPMLRSRRTTHRLFGLSTSLQRPRGRSSRSKTLSSSRTFIISPTRPTLDPLCRISGPQAAAAAPYPSQRSSDSNRQGALC